MLVYVTMMGPDRFPTAFFGIRQYRSDTFSALSQSPFNTAPIPLQYLSNIVSTQFHCRCKINTEHLIGFQCLKVHKKRKQRKKADTRRIIAEYHASESGWFRPAAPAAVHSEKEMSCEDA